MRRDPSFADAASQRGVRTVVWVLLLVSCAAGPPARSPPKEAQSYAEAVRLICDVDRLAEVDPDDPLGTEAKRSDYLIEHVKNSDGIYLITLYRAKDPKGQCELLQDAVTETKVPSCALLDELGGTVGVRSELSGIRAGP